MTTPPPAFGPDPHSRVLVTGAAGTIGGAVARSFTRAGARVVVSDLGGDSLESLIQDIEPVAAIPADLRSVDECADLPLAASSALGGLDVVAHMSGLLRRRAHPSDVTLQDWDIQHEVNLRSTFFLFRSAADIMTSQGCGGRLIATTSQAWWSGGVGGSTVYAATKGGLVSLCRGLARSYGPAGITVNTVAPGAVESPMLLRDLPEDRLSDLIAQTPLGRLASPEEIAGPVLFLASAQASFITAATMNVSGGWLAY